MQNTHMIQTNKTESEQHILHERAFTNTQVHNTKPWASFTLLPTESYKVQKLFRVNNNAFIQQYVFIVIPHNDLRYSIYYIP